MSALEGFLLLLHVGVAIAICGFVLLQHGKGADMGAAFGSGSSGSLFGATGSANFLSRSTAALATVFFCCTLALAYMSNSTSMRGSESGGSVLDRPAPAASAPAAGSIPGAIPGAAPGAIPGAVPTGIPATAPAPSAAASR